MCKISARYVKACRRKGRKTGGRRPGRTDGRRPDGESDGDPDGHHHSIIRPVWRIKQFYFQISPIPVIHSVHGNPIKQAQIYVSDAQIPTYNPKYVLESFGIRILMIITCINHSYFQNLQLQSSTPWWCRGCGLDWGSGDSGSIPGKPSPRVDTLMVRRSKTSVDVPVPVSV